MCTKTQPALMLRHLSLTTLAVAVFVIAAATARAQPGPATGDAARGEELFTSVYKCYACHGFDAQTGQRRLVPMNYTEEGFITFVQNSPLPQMPPYAGVSARDLADVYTYIRSLPADAPDVEDLPLLQDIVSETRRALSR
jgi:mono/diheme cytochrome c family protein